MKTTIITFFAAASALIAAETNSPAPTLPTNAASAIQVDLIEHARLVAEIGQEAAKGFDAETHARSLRAQIDALVSKPTPANPVANADTVDNTAPATDTVPKAPAITAPAPTAARATTSVTGPDPGALKEAIRILRAEADRLEAQLEKLA